MGNCYGDTDRSGEILKVNGCSEIVFDADGILLWKSGNRYTVCCRNWFFAGVLF